MTSRKAPAEGDAPRPRAHDLTGGTRGMTSSSYVSGDWTSPTWPRTARRCTASAGTPSSPGTRPCAPLKSVASRHPPERTRTVNADRAPYAWQITYDHLDHRRDDTSGPRNADEKLLAGIQAGVLMQSGRCGRLTGRQP
jgi:hypothetical protein